MRAVARGAPPGAGPGASRAGRTCSRCALPAAVQCSRCKQAYCDPDCQRADWRAGHRLECAPPPDDARPESPVEDIPSDSEDPVQALAGMIVAARAKRAEAERAAKAKADEETANKTNVECHLVNLSGTPPPPPGVTVVMTDGRYYRDNQPGGFDVTREEETVPDRDEQRRRLRHKLELKRQGRASTRGPPGT